MDKIMVSKEKIDYTIDLLITMVVEELSEEMGRDSRGVLINFLSSKTGKALYAVENRLWWNGPSYIADLYMEEIQLEKRIDSEVKKSLLEQDVGAL